MTATLHLWTVYNSPSDYPGKYVARLFLVGGPSAGPTQTVVLGDTLEAVRAQLPRDLYNLGRQDDDDAKIVETWI